MHGLASRHHLLMLEPAGSSLGWLIAALVRRGHRITNVIALKDLRFAVARQHAGGSATIPPALVIALIPAQPRAGQQLVRRLAEATALPCILVASGEDDLADRVAALELGAEDYLQRDMPRAEMLARVHAALRRLARNPGAAPVAPPKQGVAVGGQMLPGGWRLLPHRRTLKPPDGGPVIRLTGAEFELLHRLAIAAGDTLDRERLSRAVFHRPWREGDRAVDGLVKRLRRKVPDYPIVTVRGQGYALPVEGTAVAPVEGTAVAPVAGTAVAPVAGKAVAPVEGTAVAPVEGNAVAPVKGKVRAAAACIIAAR